MKTKFILLIVMLFLTTITTTCQARTDEDTTVVVLIPIQDVIPDDGGEIHRQSLQPLCIGLLNHTLYIYADAEKQVSIFPVDYDDETDPLYTTYVSENTYSCVLPSWLIGVYAIEIEINGIVFVGEIEL